MRQLIDRYFERTKQSALARFEEAVALQVKLFDQFKRCMVKYSVESGQAPDFKWELVCHEDDIPELARVLDKNITHTGGWLDVNEQIWLTYQIEGFSITIRCRANQ